MNFPIKILPNFFKFLIHVKKYFKFKKTSDSENLILVELNTHKSAMIGLF